MFGKDLVDSPFAIPDSLIQFVAGACDLLRERCDLAQLRDTIDGRLAVE